MNENAFLEILMQKANQIRQVDIKNPMYQMGRNSGIDDLVSRMIDALQIKKEQHAQKAK